MRNSNVAIDSIGGSQSYEHWNNYCSGSVLWEQFTALKVSTDNQPQL